MNIQEYSHQFPNDTAAPSDAIEAIVDKIHGWMRQSLFREKDFVSFFGERIMGIISRLPEDPESRKPLEVEIAYIMHALSSEYGIVISQNGMDPSLRAIEYQLARVNQLTSYTRFTEGETEEIDISEPKHMELYLECRYRYAFRGIKHLYPYIETCVRLSQLPGGALILQSHLGHIYKGIEESEVDAMLEENDYLGGTELSKHIKNLQKGYKDETGDDLSDEETLHHLSQIQRSCARFHLLLNHLARNVIAPEIDSLPREEQKKLFDRLNDFRDINDPDMYIEASFNSFNTLEKLARLRWEEAGREIH